MAISRPRTVIGWLLILTPSVLGFVVTLIRPMSMQLKDPSAWADAAVRSRVMTYGFLDGKLAVLLLSLVLGVIAGWNQPRFHQQVLTAICVGFVSFVVNIWIVNVVWRLVMGS